MTPKNEVPDLLMTPFQTVIEILEQFGWFFLIGLFVAIYIYHKYYPKYLSWKQKQEEYDAAEESKKNPDKSYKIQVSVEEARMKLQEQVNKDAIRRKEQQEKLMDQKRKEKIEEWDNHKQGKGYHSKYKSCDTMSESPNDSDNVKSNKQQRLRTRDYNPLSGNDADSCSWRPGRRNISGGG